MGLFNFLFGKQATTSESFKSNEKLMPDYGIFMKKHFPRSSVYNFYNVGITDISRVGLMDYSLFITYVFDKKEYAASLDFSQDLLPDLLRSLKRYAESADIDLLNAKLTDLKYRYKVVEWKTPINIDGCEAILGQIEVNQNESYIPFKIKKFL